MIINKLAANTNVNKFLLQWLKLLITVAAFAYIIIVVLSIPEEQIFQWLDSMIISYHGLLLFFVVFILTFFNWLAESEKWRTLANYLEKLSLRRSFISILFGNALGMITPKRLGEYAGRIIVLSRENRIKGLLLNSLASITQLSVTVAMGIISLVIAFAFHDNADMVFRYNTSHILAFSVVIFVGLICLMVFMKPLARIISKYIRPEKWKENLMAFELVRQATIYKLIFLSLTRYLIFIIQFFILIKIFGMELNIFALFVLQSISYLVMTIIPVSALAESGVKSSVTLIIFSSFPLLSGDFNPASLISASLALWFFNLVLPAFSGVLISFFHRNKTLKI